MVRHLTLSGLGLPLTGDTEMGHFDADSPGAVVIYDAGPRPCEMRDISCL